MVDGLQQLVLLPRVVHALLTQCSLVLITSRGLRLLVEFSVLYYCYSLFIYDYTFLFLFDTLPLILSSFAAFH